MIHSHTGTVYQIGYRKDARMLAGTGPGINGKTVRSITVGDSRMVHPESVNTPSEYGITSDRQYSGGCSWSSVEMFAHVKTTGYHGMKVI